MLKFLFSIMVLLINAYAFQYLRHTNEDISKQRLSQNKMISLDEKLGLQHSSQQVHLNAVSCNCCQDLKSSHVFAHSTQPQCIEICNLYKNESEDSYKIIDKIQDHIQDKFQDKIWQKIQFILSTLVIVAIQKWITNYFKTCCQNNKADSCQDNDQQPNNQKQNQLNDNKQKLDQDLDSTRDQYNIEHYVQ